MDLCNHRRHGFRWYLGANWYLGTTTPYTGCANCRKPWFLCGVGLKEPLPAARSQRGNR